MTMSSSHCDINRGQGPGLDRPASWPTRPFQDNLYDGTAQHTPLGPASDGCLLVRTAYTKEWVCKAHADCPSGYYCDNARECWKCDVISELLCDSLLGDDDCCAPDFAGGSGSCPAADYPGVAARCNETLGLRVAGPERNFPNSRAWISRRGRDAVGVLPASGGGGGLVTPRFVATRSDLP